MIRRNVLRRSGVGIALLTSTVYLPASVRGQGLTAIASFNQTNSGAYPDGGVTIGPNGNLFGTTSSGGDFGNGYGTVWEIVQGSSTITPLAYFNGTTNGVTPESGVSFDTNGNLFGTTSSGGTNDNGTVWEIKAGTTTITTLDSFNSNTTGSSPVAGVTIDASGNLFGTASQGGANGDGTVWEIKAGTTSITTFASFSGGTTGGSSPVAGVTLDAKGDLFGTTEFGGLHGVGTVWEIPAGTSNLITLASFSGVVVGDPSASTGGNPNGGVTVDSKGDLFGTTLQNGAYGYGTVWEIPAGTSNLITLASFDRTNGMDAASGVTLDTAGDLFGTTQAGGAYGDGTVWELLAGTTTLIALASLDGTNGSIPMYGDVTIGANGTLFGTAQTGGTFSDGTVWEIQAAAVPEPSSIVTGLIGLVLTSGFVLARRARLCRRACSSISA